MYLRHRHHRCASAVSCGWAKASACCFHFCLYCAIFCQMVPFHYLSSSSLHFLAGLLLDRFPSYGLHVVIRNVHRLYCVILKYPTQVHFCLLTLLICHCWKYVRIIWLFKKCPMSLLEMFGECDAVILLCISLSWCLSLHVLYSCPRWRRTVCLPPNWFGSTVPIPLGSPNIPTFIPPIWFVPPFEAPSNLQPQPV